MKEKLHMMRFLRGCVFPRGVKTHGSNSPGQKKTSIPVSCASFTSATSWQVDLGGCYLKDGLPWLALHIQLCTWQVKAGFLFSDA